MPTDSEMLDWLADQCFLPGDMPDTGCYAVVSEELAPLGTFTGKKVKDSAAFRKAVSKAMQAI